jgi:membrane fusion protein
MESPLFRPEAIVHQRQRLWGELLLTQPIATRALTLFLVVIVGVGCCYLLWGEYARKQRVHGYLVPHGGWLKVYAMREGVIVALHVKEGEIVSRGAPLVTVSSAQHLSRGEEVSAELLASLDRDVSDIRAQHARLRRLENLAGAELEARLRGTHSEIAGLEVQAALQRDRLEILERRMVSLGELARSGHVASSQYDAARESYLAELQRLRALERDADAHNATLVRLHAERERLPLEFRDRQAALNARLSEAARARVEVRSRTTYTINAPVGGQISGMQAAVGAEVSRARPLLTLLAKDAVLEAVLFVPSRAVGFVRSGQEVRLRFDAFPHERFGDQGGVVVQIDKSILAPSELPDPVITREPVYRVRARPQRGYMEAYGDRFPLRPGMALEADIVTDRRSLLMWLLDPLLSLRGRLG